MSNELVAGYVGRGLTEKEAEILAKWTEAGKPNLSKYRAERLGEIYILGYSCQEINKWFPEYPVEILLWCRVHYDWDLAKEKYRVAIHNDTLEAAKTVRIEGLRFLSDIMAATHIKWRKQILSYMANPDKEVAPECLPKKLSEYGHLMGLMDTIMAPPSNGGGSNNNNNNNNNNDATPLVNINVTADKEGKPDIVITPGRQDAIKRALMEEMDDNGENKRN